MTTKKEYQAAHGSNHESQKIVNPVDPNSVPEANNIIHATLDWNKIGN